MIHGEALRKWLAIPFDEQIAWHRRDAPVGSLTFHVHVNAFTGYGQHSYRLAIEVERAGYPVRVLPLSRDESNLPIPRWIENRIIAADDDGPPRFVSAVPSTPIRPGDAILTMWESSRLNPAWVSNLNRASVVIVPSRWNVEVFRDSGVTAPIRTIPFGVSSVFSPGNPPPARPFRFGCGGRLAHGGVRKGVEDVIAAFLDAFPGDPGVELSVKVWPDCEIDGHPDPRIKLIRDPLTDRQLADWYRSLHVFVSASKGEAWGFMPLQAMACGVPAIAPHHGGHAEYMTPENSWPVAYETRPAGPGEYHGLGDWIVPHRDSLIGRMREARADEPTRAMFAEDAAWSASWHPWTHAGDALIEVLREFNIVAPEPPARDEARVAMEADACEWADGPLECGPDRCRSCSKPGRAGDKRRGDCLACVREGGHH